MKRWQLLFFLFSISSSFSWAQVRIHIENDSYAGIPLRFYAYETLATHNPKLIKTATIDGVGKLSATLPIQEAQLLYIPLLSFHFVFYATPNQEITLKLPPFIKLKEAFSKLKNYSGREIPLFITEQNSLNQTIAQYDKAYNNFLSENFQNIYLKKNAENSQKELLHLQNLHSFPYFQNYVTYKEAYLYYVSGEQATLLSRYFANKPLLLHNTAYVSLLRKLAIPLATDISKAPKYRKRYRNILTANNYQTLHSTLQGISNTNDTDFDEHFFVYIMLSGITQKTISREVAIKKLQLIAKGSTNEKNRKLATSVLNTLQKKFAGRKAPNFSLQTTDGKNYTAYTFKSSKPTLLAFFDSMRNNIESIKTLHELQGKYNNVFQVCVFSAEKKIENLPKNWVQFVVPYHSYLLHDYHLGRFPYYVLVDKDGRISEQTWQQYLISFEE